MRVQAAQSFEPEGCTCTRTNAKGPVNSGAEPCGFDSYSMRIFLTDVRIHTSRIGLKCGEGLVHTLALVKRMTTGPTFRFVRILRGNWGAPYEAPTVCSMSLLAPQGNCIVRLH